MRDGSFINFFCDYAKQEDEADDSVDRLVIDESDGIIDGGGAAAAAHGAAQEFQENEVPECQGCNKREAQFVCAGCGNQWYCSRTCQVRTKHGCRWCEWPDTN